MAPYMLKLMLRSSGEAEIYPFAKDYLTIYFLKFNFKTVK